MIMMTTKMTNGNKNSLPSHSRNFEHRFIPTHHSLQRKFSNKWRSWLFKVVGWKSIEMLQVSEHKIYMLPLFCPVPVLAEGTCPSRRPNPGEHAQIPNTATFPVPSADHGKYPAICEHGNQKLSMNNISITNFEWKKKPELSSQSNPVQKPSPILSS